MKYLKYSFLVLIAFTANAEFQQQQHQGNQGGGGGGNPFGGGMGGGGGQQQQAQPSAALKELKETLKKDGEEFTKESNKSAEKFGETMDKMNEKFEENLDKQAKETQEFSDKLYENGLKTSQQLDEEFTKRQNRLDEKNDASIKLFTGMIKSMGETQRKLTSTYNSVLENAAYANSNTPKNPDQASRLNPLDNAFAAKPPENKTLPSLEGGAGSSEETH
jgi:hypothetical protein